MLKALPTLWIAIAATVAPAGAAESIVTLLPAASAGPIELEDQIDALAATDAPASPALLAAIAAWLSASFGLAPTDEPPHVLYVSQQALVVVRHADVAADRWSGGGSSGDAEPGALPEILAVYDGPSRTIYLLRGWSARDPADLSVLVHEMVHHMQNLAGLGYACPEAREALAFEAQERWLARFGRDLSTDFDLDAFSILARTQCLY